VIYPALSLRGIDGNGTVRLYPKGAASDLV